MDIPTTNDKSKYTTSRGYVITFKSIPTLLQKLAAQFPAPTPPTYEVKTATGGVELHAHDETTLETDADKQTWAAYQLAVRTHALAMAQAQMRLMLLEGITIENEDALYAAQAEWVARQEFIGFKIPSGKYERELYFKETEITASTEDVLAILAGVGRASGVDEEAVSTLEDSFRRALGKAGTGNAVERTAVTDTGDEQGMEHVDALRANGNGSLQDAQGTVVVGFTG